MSSKIKTSISHPLNISWILPPGIRSDIAIKSIMDSDVTTTSADISPVFDDYTFWRGSIKRHHDQLSPTDDKNNISHHHICIKINKNQTSSEHLHSHEDDINESPLPSPLEDEPAERTVRTRSHDETLGNIALSSAPGKKIRLTPLSPSIQIKRSPVCRDLDHDFDRISSHRITAIVNLLDNAELELLAIPWKHYLQKAEDRGIAVIRYPIVEGFAPKSIDDFEQNVMDKLQAIRDQNVLIHCRGGIGRAGLVACCWLLKFGHINTAKDAIEFVRRRRSRRAIETVEQEEFIARYADYARKKPDKE